MKFQLLCIFLPMSICHDTGALRNVLAFSHVVQSRWVFLNSTYLVPTCPEDISSLALLSFCGVGEACFSLYQIHNQCGLYPPIPGIIHAVTCSCGLCACPFESSNLARETRGPFWLQRLSCRLRSVKMEQRKLNDQANTLVDLAKVISPKRLSPHGCNHGN